MIPEVSCLSGSQKVTFGPSWVAEDNWWDCYDYEQGYDAQSLLTTRCRIRNSWCNSEECDDERAEYHGNFPHEQTDLAIPSLWGVGGKGTANQSPMMMKVPNIALIRLLITGYRLSGTTPVIATNYRSESCGTWIKQRLHSTNLRKCRMPLLALLVRR
ncbi:hypothetical protein COCSADRAFT_244713 [Bipolaris sorokiniana ND90Pr]|uniref:Uncharacterized protein n=1 Tax=Cochliobolus sativus (strain ND90Pr / ATCC 201652) TaxID=665912 RepID=M2QZX1_COCSN|nr:uncharacterized protein COCSADRAFT_244713 [Bipolaris sorokiniana ND90Pr]EMD60599.1 hypothetical protein COCSADRAFT_244713 [Bipolaris sorokiniana ND90Pr]